MAEKSGPRGVETPGGGRGSVQISQGFCALWPRLGSAASMRRKHGPACLPLAHSYNLARCFLVLKLSNRASSPF